MQRKNVIILENIALIIYVVSISCISSFHEPWFDEAQAWLIARDSGILNMILHVLRYEGHPPLWYLCLYVPAHMGIPYEWGLKSVNIIISSIAAAMIIKKAPFPLVVRLLTPFTYFIFYQYGVISRCYSLLSLALWVVAANIPLRNRKPVKFSLLLALLGGVTAHGMMISFGVAVAWFIEMVMDHRLLKKDYNVMTWRVAKDRRFHALLLLGMVNLIYTAILWPMPDKYTPGLKTAVDPGNLLFMLFVAPLNGIATDLFSKNFTFTYDMMYVCIAGFILTIVFFIWVLNKGMFLYCALPYLFTTIFMSFVYFSIHHTGIYTLMIIFGIWVSLGGEQSLQAPAWSQKLYSVFSDAVSNQVVINRLLTIFAAFVFAIQIYWSAAASLNDIRFPYTAERDLATFIKDNGIEGRKIFQCYPNREKGPEYFMQNVALLPYFPNNIIYNHNNGDKKVSYATHIMVDDEKVLKQLQEAGKPDFIIENGFQIFCYDNIFEPLEYVPVALFETRFMWKNLMIDQDCKLYIRKDLLPQFPKLKQIKGNYMHPLWTG
ncbi:MAG: hypothetical protein ACOY31_05695 [Bacillota bacterium]